MSPKRPPVPPPALDFRWATLDEITPWDLNPRDNAEAIPKVAASIREFGFVAPIVVWTSRGQIVAGHTRLAALRAILAADPGFVPKGAPKGTPPGTAPVRFHEFDDDAAAASYAIADNRLNELARWDVPKLTAILGTLQAPKLTITGFDASMLSLPPLAKTEDIVAKSGDTTEAGNLATPGGSREANLRFAEFRFAMDATEEAALRAHLDEYADTHGTYDGWVGYVLSRLSS